MAYTPIYENLHRKSLSPALLHQKELEISPRMSRCKSGNLSFETYLGSIASYRWKNNARTCLRCHLMPFMILERKYQNVAYSKHCACGFELVKLNLQYIFSSIVLFLQTFIFFPLYLQGSDYQSVYKQKRILFFNVYKHRMHKTESLAQVLTIT